jgi:hypothetical protein
MHIASPTKITHRYRRAVKIAARACWIVLLFRVRSVTYRDGMMSFHHGMATSRCPFDDKTQGISWLNWNDGYDDMAFVTSAPDKIREILGCTPPV